MKKKTKKSQDRWSGGHWEGINKSAGEVLNVRAKVTEQRTPLAVIIDIVGVTLAHPFFIVAFILVHLLWVVLNLPIYPWFEPWDPYPFMFLATITSAEAPFIALLVLAHQWRNTRIEELREEINVQVSLHIEREVTILMRLLMELQEKLGVETEQDPELLQHLQEEMDPQRLMDSLRRHLRQAEGEKTGAP